ncbi:MAG: hypothetical protein JW781_03175 [Deltaproteobacteria bacterium]|nr:hypothetical protein [Candidatus Anaeroferrophillacea bacterium]
MCMKIEIPCQCNSEKAQFNNLNNILPPAVILTVYCPACSDKVKIDPATMLHDNGWIIEYDMEQIRFLLGRFDIPAARITPAFVFDERYSTWQGITPTDFTESLREREALLEISRVDKRTYAEALKNWSIKRMQAFTTAGWRKAQPAAA